MSRSGGYGCLTIVVLTVLGFVIAYLVIGPLGFWFIAIMAIGIVGGGLDASQYEMRDATVQEFYMGCIPAAQLGEYVAECSVKGEKGVIRKIAVVSYEDENGKGMKGYIRINMNDNNWQPSSKIKVYVDKNDPTKIKTKLENVLGT